MKAVLVLDKMPENCMTCRYYQNYKCYADTDIHKYMMIADPKCRPLQCPLKPISDEMFKTCEQKCDWDLFLNELEAMKGKTE